jgi:transcriptional regulator with XRE-family HTH domain
MQENFWGSLITRLRKEKRVPQRRLAVLAGVNRNSLRFIETGKQEPSIYVLERILGCLDHELDAIEVLPPGPRPEKTSCTRDASA